MGPKPLQRTVWPELRVSSHRCFSGSRSEKPVEAKVRLCSHPSGSWQAALLQSAWDLVGRADGKLAKLIPSHFLQGRNSFRILPAATNAELSFQPSRVLRGSGESQRRLLGAPQPSPRSGEEEVTAWEVGRGTRCQVPFLARQLRPGSSTGLLFKTSCWWWWFCQRSYFLTSS